MDPKANQFRPLIDEPRPDFGPEVAHMEAHLRALEDRAYRPPPTREEMEAQLLTLEAQIAELRLALDPETPIREAGLVAPSDAPLLEVVNTQQAKDLGWPIFDLGETFPLRGYVWQVEVCRGSRMVLRGVGPTKRARQPRRGR